MLKPEKLWKFIRANPYVMGSFMWTGVDYLGESIWPHKNSTSGVLDTCGFEKDGFYFYKSIWTSTEPVLYAFPHLNLPYPDGTIIPLIVYTNCFSVELIMGGQSYGVKAYEFPFKGMTGFWGHFDGKLSPVTTSDLHLSWDIPVGHSEIVLIGRNENGEEIIRRILKRAGEPDHLRCIAHTEKSADKACIQLEAELCDKDGIIVPDHDTEIAISVIGGTLLGMDNGKSDDCTPYRCRHRNTWKGRLYAIIDGNVDSKVHITLSGYGIRGCEMEIDTL